MKTNLYAIKNTWTLGPVYVWKMRAEMDGQFIFEIIFVFYSSKYGEHNTYTYLINARIKLYRFIHKWFSFNNYVATKSAKLNKPHYIIIALTNGWSARRITVYIALSHVIDIISSKTSSTSACFTYVIGDCNGECSGYRVRALVSHSKCERFSPTSSGKTRSCRYTYCKQTQIYQEFSEVLW